MRWKLPTVGPLFPGPSDPGAAVVAGVIIILMPPLAFLMGVSVPVRILPPGPTAPPLPLIVRGRTVAPPAAEVATELGLTTLAETLGTDTAWMLATPCGVIVGPPAPPAVDSLPMGFSCVIVSEGCTLAVMVTGGRIPAKQGQGNQFRT